MCNLRIEIPDASPEVMDALTTGIQYLVIDRWRGLHRLQQFDVERAGIGEADAHVHLGGLPAVFMAVDLEIGGEERPGAVELDPLCHGGFQIANDVTDLG